MEWVHTIRITRIKEIQSWCKSFSESPVSSLWREVHNCQNKNIVCFLPTSPTSYNFPSHNGRMEWPIVVNFYSNQVNIQNETYYPHCLTLEKQFITGALALIIYLNIPRRQRFLSFVTLNYISCRSRIHNNKQVSARLLRGREIYFQSNTWLDKITRTANRRVPCSANYIFDNRESYEYQIREGFKNISSVN